VAIAADSYSLLPLVAINSHWLYDTFMCTIEGNGIYATKSNKTAQESPVQFSFIAALHTCCKNYSKAKGKNLLCFTAVLLHMCKPFHTTTVQISSHGCMTSVHH